MVMLQFVKLKCPPEVSLSGSSLLSREAEFIHESVDKSLEAALSESTLHRK